MGLRPLALAVLAAIPTAALISAAPAPGGVAITVSGTRTSHDPPFPEELAPGYFAGDTVERIDYPAALFGMDQSIAVAATGIVAGIADAVGPVVVAGFSQGAVAVARAKQELMALPPQERPSPELLSFLTIGDPSGPGGIMNSLLGKVPVLELTPIVAPDTPYRSVVVNGEYDGWADYPDRQWNLLSVVNALLGTIYVHGGYEAVPGGLDIARVPAANISTAVNGLGGATTLYLLPTGELPLVGPLRDIGVPEPVVAAIEKPLKAIVDAGYARNDVAGNAAAVPPARAAASAPRAPRGRGPLPAAVESEAPRAAESEASRAAEPAAERPGPAARSPRSAAKPAGPGGESPRRHRAGRGAATAP